MSIVASCTSRKATCPTGLSPSTALATCEMTVGEPASYATACVWWASHETPATSVPRTQPITTRVLRAFLPCGLRKALTPLEIASSPVSDDPPLACLLYTSDAADDLLCVDLG